MSWTSLTGEIIRELILIVYPSINQDSMFRGSWRQMWDKAAEFFDDKIDVLVNNAGVSPKLGYDICMKVRSSLAALLQTKSYILRELRHRCRDVFISCDFYRLILMES